MTIRRPENGFSITGPVDALRLGTSLPPGSARQNNAQNSFGIPRTRVIQGDNPSSTPENGWGVPFIPPTDRISGPTIPADTSRSHYSCYASQPSQSFQEISPTDSLQAYTGSQGQRSVRLRFHQLLPCLSSLLRQGYLKH